jgi:hypothetical protein
MTGQRRQVCRSDYFLETACAYFPPGGSVDGRPSFDLFETGPLRAVEDLCAHAFEQMVEVYPGIRAWTTIDLPFFMPMTFYAALDTSGSVELLDLTCDIDYEWDAPHGTSDDDS